MTVFRSFWLGGFESACHKLCDGRRVDMLAATGHDRRLTHDYSLLAAAGICTVREAIPWPRVEQGGHYDLSLLKEMLAAARATGVQVIWSLCHYGWPDDVDVYAPAFPERFARYAAAVAQVIRDESPDAPFYNPINEISFLAWAAGEMGFIYPCRHGQAHALKRQLVRATIAACDALWDVDSRARIVHTDPLIQVIASPDDGERMARARREHEAQFEAYDMLGGYAQPELGGHPRYLDILGVNFYHDNQREVDRPMLSWEDRLASGDPRWMSLNALLAMHYARYRRPLFLAETSHFGGGRATWLEMVAGEVCDALERGVPVEGICLYPVLNRPDWFNPEHWHHSGLWDLRREAGGELVPVVDEGYRAALSRAQAMLHSG